MQIINKKLFSLNYILSDIIYVLPNFKYTIITIFKIILNFIIIRSNFLKIWYLSMPTT